MHVVISLNVRLPDLLLPDLRCPEDEWKFNYLHQGSFANVAPQIDGLTVQQLKDIYAQVSSSFNVLASHHDAEFTFLRYGARSLGLDLFHVVARGFQCIEWSGLVALAPESAGNLAGGLAAVRALRPDDAEPGHEICSGLQCVSFRRDGFKRRGFRGWRGPLVDDSQKMDITSTAAAAIWKSACDGSLEGMRGESLTLALVLIQHQHEFSSDMKVPHIFHGDVQADDLVLSKFRQGDIDVFSFAGRGSWEPEPEFSGTVSDKYPEPQYKVRCNGQWFRGHPLKAQDAEDFAVRIEFTCCVDFGGYYWHVGSEHFVLLSVKLEVTSAGSFELATAKLATARRRGIPMS